MTTETTPLVAPEFVITLQEDAQATLKKYLKKIEAPADILQLLQSVADLGYYLAEYERKPGYFGKDQFDIEGLVIETVNAIASAGGVFHGTYTYSLPRDEEIPTEAA